MKSKDRHKNRRIATYISLFVALTLGFALLRDSTWQGSTQLHTIMELIATTLAFFVGAIALVRYYTRKNNTFLFIGAGFLGTALLDGYHTLVTSTFFDYMWPSPPPSLIPWSWNASRIFLSLLMVLSWWAWKREDRLGKAGRIPERSVFLLVGLLTMASFLFFALYPLPRAYYPELFFGRPEEFVSAFFFLAALFGYLEKGWWKRNRFDHWVVLSLIVGFMGQAMFMSFSFQLFDPMFDAAHLLKKVSYICVLTGLLVSMFYLFRRAEESENELKKILDSSPDSIILTDLKGDIIQCNRSGLEMHGFSSQKEMVGMNILDLVTPEDRGPMESWQLLPEIGSVRDLETVLLRKNGSRFSALVSASLIRDEDGIPAFVVATGKDISVQKNAERMKDEFVSVVSHEIRTPLTSIHGSLSLIASGKAGEFPEQASSLIEIAARNCRRLKILIDDILDLQRIESGRVELNLEPLELKPLIEQAIEANRSYGEQYDTKYVLELDLPDVKVKADSNCLMQVMNNLLSNAAKYSPPKSQVEVSLSCREGSVRVTVKDHGPGIPRDFQGRIFQKFQRADSKATREKGGTGLGLSIAKSIVELHGGKIDFETTIGKGTTFYFDLPEWRDKEENKDKDETLHYRKQDRGDASS